ncbi:hypothetical protein ABPG77_005560 [Micractinium sp. CCAP 211/92]
MQEAVKEVVQQGLPPTVQQAVHQAVLEAIKQALPAVHRCNGRSLDPGARLEPVPHPDTGALPPNFPANNRALNAMTYAQLGKLLAFYGEPVAGNTEARRKRLKIFIGQFV